MHTPGPWKAFNEDGKHVQADEWSTDCDGAQSSTHAPIKAGDRVVALVVASSRRWPSLPDITPNCHLIAAAPELLAFLERLRAAGEWYTSALEFSSGIDGRELFDAINALIAKAKGGAA